MFASACTLHEKSSERVLNSSTKTVLRTMVLSHVTHRETLISLFRRDILKIYFCVFSGAKHPLTLVSQAMLNLCDEKLKEVDVYLLLGLDILAKRLRTNSYHSLCRKKSVWFVWKKPLIPFWMMMIRLLSPSSLTTLSHRR